MNKQCICNREYEREGWQACRHILLHVSWCPMSVNYRAPKSIFQKIADFFNPNRMTKPELIAELGRRLQIVEHPELPTHVYRITSRITLPRVLAALAIAKKSPSEMFVLASRRLRVRVGQDRFAWTLRDDKNTRDLTADDQSEETLKALIDLLPSND